MTTSCGPAVTTRTVPAWQLRPGWVVIPDHGAPRCVASNRLEGARPLAVVAYADVPQRVTYPATQLLTVKDLR